MYLLLWALIQWQHWHALLILAPNGSIFANSFLFFALLGISVFKIVVRKFDIFDDFLNWSLALLLLSDSTLVVSIIFYFSLDEFVL
jgi:hypothetical protein